MKIVVVHNYDTSEMCKILFEKRGWEVHYVGTCQEGVSLILRVKPNVVLTQLRSVGEYSGVDMLFASAPVLRAVSTSVFILEKELRTCQANVARLKQAGLCSGVYAEPMCSGGLDPVIAHIEQN